MSNKRLRKYFFNFLIIVNYIFTYENNQDDKFEKYIF